jgi:hypothetical protein
MAGYLIPQVDYIPAIQTANLNAVIGGQSWLLLDAEDTATDEAESVLKQKYDISDAFQSVEAWDPTITTYQPGNRVFLNAANYSSAASYVPGNMVVNGTYPNSTLYVCTSDTTGTFDPTAWTAIGPQYAMYYVPFPPGSLYAYPDQAIVNEFDFNAQYALNDLVYWNGIIYKCLRQTMPLGQETAIQFYKYENLPLSNVVPDNVNYGFQFWANVAPYSLPASTPLTNPTYWTAGDNRGPKLRRCVVDMALYYLHRRIAPENVPAERAYAYKASVKWLEDCARGEKDPAIPLLRPTQGLRTRFGGPIKNQNSY